MELQADQRRGTFPAVILDVGKEMWRYTAIRNYPYFKRPLGSFWRGRPVVCDVFGILSEGLIIEARGDNPPALAICLKYGISTLCDECDDSCGDRYWAFSSWGGVFTSGDLQKIIDRSKSLVMYLHDCGVEQYRQAIQALKLIEELESRQGAIEF